MKMTTTAILVALAVSLFATGSDATSATCNGAAAQQCFGPNGYMFPAQMFWSSRVPKTWTKANINQICANVSAANECVLAAGCALTDSWNYTSPTVSQSGTIVQPYNFNWATTFAVLNYSCNTGFQVFSRHLQNCFNKENFFGSQLDRISNGLCVEPTDPNNCTQSEMYIACLNLGAEGECDIDTAAFISAVFNIYLSSPNNWLSVQLNKLKCPLMIPTLDNCICGPPAGNKGCYDCQTNGTCITANNEYYLIPATESCFPCPDGCYMCPVNGPKLTPAGCDACLPGWTLDNTTFQCSPICAPNCTSCSTPYSCTICNSGFGLLNTDGVVCSPCAEDFCIACNPNYESCTNCSAGYQIVSVNANNECLPVCDPLCVVCKAPGICSQCTANAQPDPVTGMCVCAAGKVCSIVTTTTTTSKPTTVSGQTGAIGSTTAKPIPYIPRKQWGAKGSTSALKPFTKPVKKIVIHQTFDKVCTTKWECIKLMQDLQAQQVSQRKLKDIAYNFCIGQDGNIYEGVGAGVQGQAMSKAALNADVISIGFLGDWKQQLPSKLSLAAAEVLFNYLVPQYLISEYTLNAHGDLECTFCPGGVFEQSVPKLFAEYYDKKAVIACGPGSRGWLHAM